MLESLKREVYEANLLLQKHGLVSFTWGNASGIDRDSGLVVIKPSGVEYEKLIPDDMVIVELDTGSIVESLLKPSSDTPTHLELYKAFSHIGGVVHTHSKWATIFSQAMLDIPPLGTTHADYFRSYIPCTRDLDINEINGDYEVATGRVIVERFNSDTDLSALDVTAVLVARHGPFTWGDNAIAAAENAAVLEIVAMLAWHTLEISSSNDIVAPKILQEKHFNRKHGSKAYYGQ